MRACVCLYSCVSACVMPLVFVNVYVAPLCAHPPLYVCFSSASVCGNGFCGVFFVHIDALQCLYMQCQGCFMLFTVERSNCVFTRVIKLSHK